MKVGLFTKQNEAVALQGVHCVATMVDTVCKVHVMQFYMNNTDRNIESAEYRFPIDSNSSICGFEAEIGEKLLVGKVLPKDKAEAEFNHAVNRGMTAAKLQQNENAGDIFSQQIGNIAARSRVNIRITYVVDLTVQSDGSTQFFLPTWVAPRYTFIDDSFAWQSSNIFKRCCSATTRIHELSAFSLALRVESSSSIVNIESTTHEIEVSDISDESRISQVSLYHKTELMGRDLIINVHTKNAHQPKLVVEKANDGSAAGMLTFVPQIESMVAVPTTIVFLVDCSGSMSGRRMAVVRKALDVFLRSLPVNCYFNIVKFGSHFKALFHGGSQRYSQETFNQAIEYCSSLTADMGGTEIMKAVQEVFSERLETMQRQVFLLTDGQVSNTKAVIAECASKSDTNRVFALGVGAAASRDLVRGVARVTKATCEFINDTELKDDSDSAPLDMKLIHQLKLATQPQISALAVDWNVAPPSYDNAVASKAPSTLSKHFETGPFEALAQCDPKPMRSDIIQAPDRAPPLLNGQKYCVYAFFPKGNLPQESVSLSAVDAYGNPMVFTVPITETKTSGRTIHVLAARRLVQDLEDGTSYMHRSICEPGLINNRIVQLGVDFQLVTSKTTFVAVEQWSDGTDGSLIVPPRDVPKDFVRASSTESWRSLRPQRPQDVLDILERQKEISKIQDQMDELESETLEIHAVRFKNSAGRQPSLMSRVGSFFGSLVPQRALYKELSPSPSAAPAAMNNVESSIQATFEKAASTKSTSLYNQALDDAKRDLSPIHPLRLKIAVGASNHLNSVGETDRACKIAKEAFDDSISELDTLSEDSYKDSTLMMQLLRDNLTAWTSDESIDHKSIEQGSTHQQQTFKRDMSALAALQQFNGSYVWNDELARIVNIDIDKLRQKLLIVFSSHSFSTNQLNSLCAMVVAAALLRATKNAKYDLIIQKTGDAAAEMIGRDGAKLFEQAIKEIDPLLS